MKNIDELYFEWSGTHHTINSEIEVHTSTETQDFGEYCMREQNRTQSNILQWAEEKGIFEKATVFTQFDKLSEECDELEIELWKEFKGTFDREKTLLEFGDVLVVLTILAKQLNTDFETCLSLAYNKIKDRTGKMENGTFIKD